MAIQTRLYGPFALTTDEVDKRVSASLGAYALGNDLAENGAALTILYVGRDDDDLNRRLKEWVWAYKFFLYGHLATAKLNYEKECWLYHTFGGPLGRLHNKIHPARPKGLTNIECPMRCGA
jgi:hypothetical protein